MNRRDEYRRSGIIIGTTVVLVGVGIVFLLNRGEDEQPVSTDSVQPSTEPTDDPQPDVSTFVAEVMSDRQELDRTVWSDEVTAQNYEQPFVRLWDDLRESSDKTAVLADFPFETLILQTPDGSEQQELGVQSIRFGDTTLEMTPGEWKQWLEQMTADGYELVQSEWHHSRFEPDPSGPRSVVSFSLDVRNAHMDASYSLKGDLLVHWAAEEIIPQTIETQRLRALSRQGPAVFEEAVEFDLKHDALSHIPMVIARDLDADGLSEIVVPSINAVFRNRGNWEFERSELLSAAVQDRIIVGILADFSGDGAVDLLGAVAEPHTVNESKSNLMLYTAGDDGSLSAPTAHVIGDSVLYHPMPVTAGDIDADGDLDVFVGQYKSPYEYGQMPTPYYDANDGYPAFLLLNDGEGRFSDVTEQAGLAAKRHRRTYGASFVDLDADNDLDLAVASDFSGLDVYLNDGSGRFTDVTDELVENRHSFGMSLTFGDYDRNSKLDFLMVGMSSTTARRLDQLGLGREQFPEHQEFRPKMGYGNYLYLAGESGFQQPSFNDQVARTGWSWGATTFDFDNDGDRDIYIANGHVSGNTSQDYCSTFWRHDIYEGSSEENPLMFEFFKINIAKELKPISWNGFEHNVLLSNQQGQGFLNIGFLAGVATECDSRNVISDDLDGDGRMDLVVVARENARAPFTMRLFRNGFESPSNWIGVRLENTHDSGLGAQVIARTAQGEVLTAVVTSGDSFKSQHAPVVHFGLGSVDAIDEITVRWPGEKTLRIANPAINQYHHASSFD